MGMLGASRRPQAPQRFVESSYLLRKRPDELANQPFINPDGTMIPFKGYGRPFFFQEKKWQPRTFPSSTTPLVTLQ